VHEQTRAWVLVALTVVGVALTGGIVWITTPASTSAGADTGVDPRALAALAPASGLNPIGPSPTLARSAPTITAGTDVSDPESATATGAPPPAATATGAATAGIAAVPDCTPVSLAQRAARTPS
jgi:hypothetical protein